MTGEGVSGGLLLSTGFSNGGHGPSGSIVMNTGNSEGATSGSVLIESGETSETPDQGGSIVSSLHLYCSQSCALSSDFNPQCLATANSALALLLRNRK